MRRWGSVASNEEDGLILFDGVCVFCSRWVRFVLRRDRTGRFRFLPIQSERGRALAQALGISPDEPETNAVILDGRAWFKSDAALAVLAELPGWGWTWSARIAPQPVRDWLYDRIAQNRYALFGRTEECMVPTPEERARFLG